MGNDFRPRLYILPPAQRRMWEELIDVPEAFTLYGCTAIALHLGHRRSVDFDFFSATSFAPDQLYRTIPFLDGGTSGHPPNGPRGNLHHHPAG